MSGSGSGSQWEIRYTKNEINIDEIKKWYEDNMKKKTDIRCWWCMHNFDTSPLGLPVRYNDKEKFFTVCGNFCSFNCMVAYSNNTRYHKRYLIPCLYRQLLNKPYEGIKPAPDWRTLKDFGGIYTIEEFRNESGNSRIGYNEVHYAPMIPIKSEIFKQEKKLRAKRISKNIKRITSTGNVIENFFRKNTKN